MILGYAFSHQTVLSYKCRGWFVFLDYIAPRNTSNNKTRWKTKCHFPVSVDSKAGSNILSDTYASMPADLFKFAPPCPDFLYTFQNIFPLECGDPMKPELLSISSTPYSKTLPDSSLSVTTTFCAKYPSSRVPITYILEFRKSNTSS